MNNDTPVEGVIRLYTKAASLIDRYRIARWEQLGLTIPQLQVLFFLQHRPNAPAGTIAQHLEVTPSTVTGLVDRLVRLSLVRRVDDRSDRRLVRASLTDKGQAILHEMGDDGATFIAEIVDRLPSEQVKRLSEGLDALVTAAQEDVQSPS